MSSANLPIKELGEYPLTGEGSTFKSITEAVCRVTENKAPRGWWIAFLIAASFTGILGLAVGFLFWIIVPIAPSMMRMRSDAAFSNAAQLAIFFMSALVVSRSSMMDQPFTTLRLSSGATVSGRKPSR